MKKLRFLELTFSPHRTNAEHKTFLLNPTLIIRMTPYLHEGEHYETKLTVQGERNDLHVKESIQEILAGIETLEAIDGYNFTLKDPDDI